MKTIKLKKESEHSVQSSVIQWLKLKHIAHFRLNTAAVTAEYKGKKRFFRSAPSGAPDIICCIKSKMILLEIKSSKGKLSDAQVAFHLEWSRAGAVSVTARSLEEAITFLTPYL